MTREERLQACERIMLAIENLWNESPQTATNLVMWIGDELRGDSERMRKSLDLAYGKLYDGSKKGLNHG